MAHRRTLQHIYISFIGQSALEQLDRHKAAIHMRPNGRATNQDCWQKVIVMADHQSAALFHACHVTD